jgi:hypothetical protein
VLIGVSQIDRVVSQLDAKPKYLYMYLDALFDKDPQFSLPYSDRMVRRTTTDLETPLVVHTTCGYSRILMELAWATLTRIRSSCTRNTTSPD